MIPDYPSPCESCTRKTCGNTGGIGCPAWRKRYLYRQKQINAYARKALDARNTSPQPSVVKDTHWSYSHPNDVRRYLYNSPCKGCGFEPTCDIPCGTYLQWYDARMAWLKERLKERL